MLEKDYMNSRAGLVGYPFHSIGGNLMGLDFTAYLGHQLDENEIYRLSHDLSAEKLKEIDLFVNRLYQYNPEDVGRYWRVNLKGLGGTTNLIGPCGMHFTFSEKVCYFHHYIRWQTFLLNEDIQLQLRKVTYDLAKYFNSSYAIYVPDSGTLESSITDFIWEDENKDIAYIKEWLHKNCGEPKENIHSIYKKYGTSWASKGYFVDYFHDFVD
jgi:hypothetical protein